MMRNCYLFIGKIIILINKSSFEIEMRFYYIWNLLYNKYNYYFKRGNFILMEYSKQYYILKKLDKYQKC